MDYSLRSISTALLIFQAILTFSITGTSGLLLLGTGGLFLCYAGAFFAKEFGLPGTLESEKYIDPFIKGFGFLIVFVTSAIIFYRAYVRISA